MYFLHRQPRHGRHFLMGKITGKVAVVARHGDHAGIVGAVLKGGDIGIPAFDATAGFKLFAELGISRYAPRDGHFADVGEAGGFPEFPE